MCRTMRRIRIMIAACHVYNDFFLDKVLRCHLRRVCGISVICLTTLMIHLHGLMRNDIIACSYFGFTY